jgi:hypothetical protein
MKTYRATEAVYVDERYIAAGEVFSTAAPKGNTWEEIDALDHDANGKKGGSKPRQTAE